MRIIQIEKDDTRVYVDETEEIEFATEKDIDGSRVVTVNDMNLEKLSAEDIHKLFKCIYFFAAKAGVNPIIESTKSQQVIKDSPQELLVRDVNPINFDGEMDISDELSLYMCIESPVRNACMLLNEMGITTLMSSANKTDVESRSQKIDRYENLGSGEHFNLGNGYAWIMIDWESLSEENKQRIIMLNNGSITIELSETEKQNLSYNCSINNKEPSQKELVKLVEVFDYRVYWRNRSRIGKLSTDSEEDAYFQANREGYGCINSLCNHGEDYRTVVLRCPLDENTTVSQASNFFMSLIKKLVDQKKQDISTGIKK